MAAVCPSGKKAYETAQLAEDVLIELWGKNTYTASEGPQSVYRCEDCGYFHLTSRGPMLPRLSEYLASKKISIDREASKWLDKFKHK